MKWIDVTDIAIELTEQHPDVNPQQLRFTELRDWVMALDNFDDDPQHCGERVLEAIQQAWIDEMD
nr:Fe-S cluster assembly protein IscX [uncultured Ferrimonas sp.]